MRLNISAASTAIWPMINGYISYVRSGTLVSADSTGSVQFWDSQHGTLLQVYSYHKGDVNALAVSPNHNRVFSAGSDGQVWNLVSFTVYIHFVHCY